MAEKIIEEEGKYAAKLIRINLPDFPLKAGGWYQVSIIAGSPSNLSWKFFAVDDADAARKVRTCMDNFYKRAKGRVHQYIDKRTQSGPRRKRGQGISI